MVTGELKILENERKKISRLNLTPTSLDHHRGKLLQNVVEEVATRGINPRIYGINVTPTLNLYLFGSLVLNLPHFFCMSKQPPHLINAKYN